MGLLALSIIGVRGYLQTTGFGGNLPAAGRAGLSQ